MKSYVSKFSSLALGALFAFNTVNADSELEKVMKKEV